MASVSRRSQRPLGHIRNSLTDATVPRFPPLKQPQSTSMENGLEGVSGNAVGTSYSSDSRQTSRAPLRAGRSPTRSLSQRSENISHKNPPDHLDRKELKETVAREKLLKQEVCFLKKQLEEVNSTLSERLKEVTTLEEKLIQKQEVDYKNLYEKEKTSHEETKSDLALTKNELEAKLVALEELRISHKNSLKNLTAEMMDKLSALKDEKDLVIQDKDSRLQRMKQQMAETLKGNSWERQQQLDELSKELTRAQEEIDMLRSKLRNIHKSKTNTSCGNCKEMESRINQTQKVLSERDQRIDELKLLCWKFEKQLKQKDELAALNNSRSLNPIHK